MDKVRLLSLCRYICIAFIVCAFSISAPVLSQEFPESYQSIIVGGVSDYPPYEFLDETGRPTGINIDLIRAIGEIYNIGISFQLSSHDASVKALIDGRIQALNMFSTDEAAQFADLSEANAFVYYILYVRRGDIQYNKIDEINGREIIVQEGSPAHKQLLADSYGATIFTVRTELDALRLLDSGMHDSALISHLGGTYLIHEYSFDNIERGSRPILPCEYCFAVAKGDSVLLNKLNDGIGTVISSGKYNDIYNEWIYKSLPEQLSIIDIIVRIKWFLLPLALTLLIAIGWSWMLRRQVAVRTNELVRVNRSLKTMSACNLAIVKADDESSLLNTICTIMTSTGNFRAALVGMSEDGSTDNIQLAAMSGIGKKLSARLIETENNAPDSYKLCHQAILTGKPVIIHNILSDEVYQPLRVIANEGNYTSAMSLPLRNDANSFGCFIIFSSEIYSFDKTELALLKELADDVSYGIMSLRTRIKHNRAIKDIENLAKFPSENPNPIIRLSYDYIILYANQPAAELLAVYKSSPGEKAPLPLIEMIEPIVEKGEITSIDITWKDQTYAFHIVPMAVEGYINLYGRNITEIIRLEEQLQQSQKMEAIGRLAGGIAHDFNNMLSVIIGYTDTMMELEKDNEQLLPLLKEVFNAGERAASLTKQLLAFSRKQVLQPEVFNLNSTISGMKDMLERLLGEDIILNTALSDDLGNIKADQGQFEQVIMNLVVNARDAMPTGGKLTIETSNIMLDSDYSNMHPSIEPGLYVMMAVSDSGMGIEEHIKEHIFEPFFTTKQKDRGTGLGLATSYGIIKQSGGNICVYSEVGKGTTFKIYLPVADESMKTNQPVTSQTILSGNETILIVEDDESVRSLVQHILERSGFTVLTATNASEAEQACSNHEKPIDLVITDIVMPGTNGKVLAERLQETYPDIETLYMSGYTDNAIVHHGILDPGTNFIGKPFSSIDLIRKVREVLDGSGLGVS